MDTTITTLKLTKLSERERKRKKEEKGGRKEEEILINVKSKSGAFSHMGPSTIFDSPFSFAKHFSFFK